MNTKMNKSEGQGTGKVLSQIARRSIEAAFRSDTEEPAIAVEGILGERHGVFVTIRGRRGKLRGCVGTLTPHFANTAEVSVLFPLEEVTSTAELDPRRYGVVLATEDNRRGVLLPDVKGIKTVGQQLTTARHKGGIGEFEPVRIQRFAVKKFREED